MPVFCAKNLLPVSYRPSPPIKGELGRSTYEYTMSTSLLIGLNQRMSKRNISSLPDEHGRRSIVVAKGEEDWKNLAAGFFVAAMIEVCPERARQSIYPE